MRLIRLKMTLKLSHKDTAELLDLIAQLNEMRSIGYTVKDEKIKDLLNQIKNFLRERSK